MSQLSRLRDEEISNGNLINADDIDVEFNQLINESNAQDTRISSIESGNLSFDGVKTFLQSPKMDAIEERTPGYGVQVESVQFQSGSMRLGSSVQVATVSTALDQLVTIVPHGLVTSTPVYLVSTDTLPSPLSVGVLYYVRVIDSISVTLHPTEGDAASNLNVINLSTQGVGTHSILADPPSPQDGQLWFNSSESVFRARHNGTTKKVLLEGDANHLPTGFMGGKRVSYASASSVIIPAGFRCRDFADTVNLVASSDLAVSLTAVGANGLDTGVEAVDTWYYLYLIGDTTNGNPVSGLFSAVNESDTGTITLPTGYNVKRQLPIALRNNTAGDLIKFSIGHGWPYQPMVLYSIPGSFWTGSGSAYTVEATNFLAGGTSTSWTTVSAANFIPPISRMALVRGQIRGSSFFHVRPGDESGNPHLTFGPHAGGVNGADRLMRVPADRTVGYIRVNGAQSLDLDVAGYVVTEVL